MAFSNEGCALNAFRAFCLLRAVGVEVWPAVALNAFGAGFACGFKVAVFCFAMMVMAMRAMHDKMSRARTPEERNALMAEHQKLMQEGMGMMGGMGPGGMGGMMGPGAGPAPADPAARQQWMEKRMEMMQSMMQMMMDRLPPPPAKP